MKETVEASSLTPAQSPSDVAPTIAADHLPKPGLIVQLAITPHRWILWIGFLVLCTLLTLIACLRIGTEAIDFPLILKILGQAVGATSDIEPASESTRIILLQVRLPRILLAFLVGGSLAAVGTALQALLRNPLADPFVIGISSGAALGAAAALLLGVGVSFWSLSALPLCAFLGALVSLFLVYRIAMTHVGFSIYTLLLAGVVLNAIFSALIMFLTTLADPNRAFGMLAWLMGNLTGPDFSTLGILACYLIAGVVVLAFQAHPLNLLTLGEGTARSLGVEVERVKKLVFLAAALLTGAVVAFSGLIGFVGLIVPHAIRLALSADHRLLLPAAGLVGGMFLMIADTVARTVLSPSEIPVGVITAMVGGPVFLYLLMNRRGRIAL